MTEELAALISRATCARCNGQGLLAHSYRDCTRLCVQPCASHKWTHGAFLCPACNGEGINPSFTGAPTCPV